MSMKLEAGSLKELIRLINPSRLIKKTERTQINKIFKKKKEWEGRDHNQHLSNTNNCKNILWPTICQQIRQSGRNGCILRDIQTKPSRSSEIIIIRTEINEIEIRKTVEQINACSLKELIRSINLWPDLSKRKEKGPKLIKLWMKRERSPLTPRK